MDVDPGIRSMNESSTLFANDTKQETALVLGPRVISENRIQSLTNITRLCYPEKCIVGHCRQSSLSNILVHSIISLQHSTRACNF